MKFEEHCIKMSKLDKYLEKVNDSVYLEMAHVGDINELSVDVYTDHNPPHFHVTKKDNFELKISITELSIIDYKWKKDDKEISSSELKSLKDWLKSPYLKNKKISNLDVIKISWETMNK